MPFKFTLINLHTEISHLLTIYISLGPGLGDPFSPKPLFSQLRDTTNISNSIFKKLSSQLAMVVQICNHNPGKAETGPHHQPGTYRQLSTRVNHLPIALFQMASSFSTKIAIKCTF